MIVQLTMKYSSQVQLQSFVDLASIQVVTSLIITGVSIPSLLWG